MALITEKEHLMRGRLGNTGLPVTRLGAGLAEIGTLSDAARASEILNTALDGGINFLDTAACYGRSEEWVGRSIAHRRREYLLATKVGHWAETPGESGWTAAAIEGSLVRSLRRMKTDYVDLLQLHSCDTELLERGEAIKALQAAKQQGKTRLIGYSGNLGTALWVVERRLVDTIQITFNLFDHEALAEVMPRARALGVGILVKHAIGDAVWGAPIARDSNAARYQRIAQSIVGQGEIAGLPENRIAVALGFVLAHDGVDVALVGTSNLDHMHENLRVFRNGLPIATSVIREFHCRLARLDVVGSGSRTARLPLT
jgi:aryl-alcohol dehydrogenase-like predicted oxidoreductase